MIVETRYGPVYYVDSGPQDALALVFTHGIAMDHATFNTQVAAFQDRYRVLVWDMPGHGRSEPLSGEFRFSTLAECLVKVLDHAGVQRAVLVGQSVGSFVSQYTAYQNPERAIALVTVGGAPLQRRMGSLQAAAWRVALWLTRAIPEQSFYRWFANDKAITDATRAYLRSTISRIGKARVLDFTRAYFRDYAAGIPGAPDLMHLITYGDREAAFISKASAQWHARTPGSHLAIVPAAGHIANQDNPEAFNQALQSFLDVLESR